MTRRQARKQFDADRAALLELWRTWDPVGGTEDDYDCQVPPMLKVLHDGANVHSLKRHLAIELTTHYGVDEPPGAEEFASTVMRWWQSRSRVDPR
jgi:hypothetical protein